MQIKLLDGVKEHADNQIKPYSETIQELRAQYAGITIAGIEDRDGYKAAAEAAKTVRAERLALQKQAGGIVKTLNDFKTKLQARAKSIIGQYSELEEEIRTEMSRIDEEKRAEKERQRPRPLPEWMPEPTIQSFPDPPDQPSADPNYRPPGFTAGFDACRNEVLAILGRKEKFTRAQLRGMVEQLKP